jgi:hypothetical protein
MIDMASKRGGLQVSNIERYRSGVLAEVEIDEKISQEHLPSFCIRYSRTANCYRAGVDVAMSLTTLCLSVDISSF